MRLSMWTAFARGVAVLAATVPLVRYAGHHTEEQSRACCHRPMLPAG
jgi:hypothetical protein